MQNRRWRRYWTKYLMDLTVLSISNIERTKSNQVEINDGGRLTRDGGTDEVKGGVGRVVSPSRVHEKRYEVSLLILWAIVSDCLGSCRYRRRRRHCRTKYSMSHRALRRYRRPSSHLASGMRDGIMRAACPATQFSPKTRQKSLK